jgi:hypothetical protein
MGRVLTEATIESLKDLWAVERGITPANQARRIIVSDALIDFVIDLRSRTLIGNPAHGGEHVFELY